MSLPLNDEERQMLKTAKRLRTVVKAHVEKRAHPALTAMIKYLGPHLAKYGPKLVEIVKAVPPQAWGQIARNLLEVLHSVGAVTASTKESTKEKLNISIRDTISIVEADCKLAGIPNASSVAKTLVLTSVKVAMAHTKKSDAKLTLVASKLEDIETELRLLREIS